MKINHYVAIILFFMAAFWVITIWRLNDVKQSNVRIEANQVRIEAKQNSLRTEYRIVADGIVDIHGYLGIKNDSSEIKVPLQWFDNYSSDVGMKRYWIAVSDTPRVVAWDTVRVTTRESPIDSSFYVPRNPLSPVEGYGWYSDTLLDSEKLSGNVGGIKKDGE